jgi:(R,R)-butanediol dehydrogenase/meso-butanediol dehydrogenase/diacetyl reductase
MSWPWGGLAEEAVVPAYQARKLPDAVTLEQGALLEPLASAYFGVKRSNMTIGDRVLITGGGPIGQLATLVLAAAGAAEIYVSEPNPVRRAMAEQLGITAAIDPTSGDLAQDILERTEGIGVDVSMECSGAGAAFDACIAATRAGGTVAQTALHLGDRTVQPETWTLKDLTIAGTWSFNYYETPEILGQIASGKLPVEKIITSRIAIDRVVPDGIEALADPAGAQVKVLVDATAA